MKDILIFAEDATLAHILRANYFAQLLQGPYNIHFATSGQYSHYGNKYKYIELKESVGKEQFLKNINNNKPIFDYRSLKRQYIENRKIIDKINPDLVIGDMRLSLIINRLKDNNFKYMNLTNSYFNPNLHMYKNGIYPLPYSRYGRNISHLIFSLFKKMILWNHVRGPNKLLDIKFDNFLYFYFSSDIAITSDDTYIFRTDEGKNKYIDQSIYNIGYLDLSLINSNKPDHQEYVYINLGSSLTGFLLKRIIKYCSKIKDYNFIISSLDNKIKYSKDNLKVIDYGNSDLVKNSILNINNSGILSVGQNLLHSKKQLCLPHNFDQHVVYEHYKNKKLINGIYSDSLTFRSFKNKIEEILGDHYMEKNIKTYSLSRQGYSSDKNISNVFKRILQ